MKSYIKIVACTTILISLIVVSSESAVANKNLVGVWKIMEVTVNRAGQKPETNKDHLPGVVIYTKNYFSWIDFHGEALPELPEKASDEQVAAVFNQLEAATGTYETIGTSINRTIIVSKNPNDTRNNSVLSYEYSFEGETLVLNFDISPDLSMAFKLKRLE